MIKNNNCCLWKSVICYCKRQINNIYDAFSNLVENMTEYVALNYKIHEACKPYIVPIADTV